MAFNGSDNDDMMSDINVTPLVDVMLVLLVVFIVTAPLLTQAVRVNLPETAKTDPPPEQHILDLSINADGQIFLNQDGFTLETLGQELTNRVTKDNELIVQIHADEKVDYGRVAKVMATAHQAGIDKLAFVTKEEPPEVPQ